jgi:hypothetical protein
MPKTRHEISTPRETDRAETRSGFSVAEAVSVLLRCSEERTTSSSAVAELRCSLHGQQSLETVVGPMADHDDLGVQLLAPGDKGFLAIRLYYDDFVEPLIVRKGTKANQVAAAASCCMTNIPCGGTLKCLTAEDPCPSKADLTGLPFQYSTSTTLRRLFEPERQIAVKIVQLATEVLRAGMEPPTIAEVTESFRHAHAHRELLLAQQPDDGGQWIDWFLKLSNGAVLAVQVALGSRRYPFLIGAEGDSFSPAGCVARFDFVSSTTGETIMAPRVYRTVPHEH